MKKLIFVLCLIATPAFAQSASDLSTAATYQARIVAIVAQRNDAMDRLAAAQADLALATDQIRALKDQLAKPQDGKPKE